MKTQIKTLSKSIAFALLCSVLCLSSTAFAKEMPSKKTHKENLRKALPSVYYSLLKAARPFCTDGNCYYPLVLEHSKKINAFTDGHEVFISKGMLNFVSSREELAIVLSHELAHNFMGHQDARLQNQVLGTIADIAAGAGGFMTFGAFSHIGGAANIQNFEREADYVGLYIMARAGYSVDKAHLFWRKMALKFPEGIKGEYGSDHPSSAERFLLLKKTAEEINRKKQLRLELLPEFSRKAKDIRI